LLISMQAGKVKLKNVSWAIAGLAMKRSKGYNDKTHAIFQFSSTVEFYIDRYISIFTISFTNHRMKMHANIYAHQHIGKHHCILRVPEICIHT
jgi:hypothetical protein